MSPTVGPDSASAAAACAAQWARISDATELLPDAAFEVVTRLANWRVADLIAHLTTCASAVPRRLADPPPAGVEIDLSQYLLSLPTVAAEVLRGAQGPARRLAPAQQRAELRAAVADLVAALEVASEGPPDRLVATSFGAMRLVDFIVTRCVEGVVHGLDLAAAVQGVVFAAELQPERAAMKLATKALLRALVAKAPGRSVEVRVPPFAAVQCVEGPRHTRGTPPNVVETDPISWLELASGRLRWQEITVDGRLRASGERSDISALFPLV